MGHKIRAYTGNSTAMVRMTFSLGSSRSKSLKRTEISPDSRRTVCLFDLPLEVISVRVVFRHPSRGAITLDCSRSSK